MWVTLIYSTPRYVLCSLTPTLSDVDGGNVHCSPPTGLNSERYLRMDFVCYYSIAEASTLPIRPHSRMRCTFADCLTTVYYSDTVLPCIDTDGVCLELLWLSIAEGPTLLFCSQIFGAWDILTGVLTALGYVYVAMIPCIDEANAVCNSITTKTIQIRIYFRCTDPHFYRTHLRNRSQHWK